MAKKNTNVTKKETKQKPMWDELKENYKNAVQTYKLTIQGLMRVGNKYKELVNRSEDLRRIIDGASKTLLGQKVILNGLALAHIELCKENKDDCFEIKNTPELAKVLGIDYDENVKVLNVRFKTGEINLNDEKELQKTIEIAYSYAGLLGNILITYKNFVSTFVTEAERIITNLPDDEREKIEKMLEEEKEELKEFENIDKNDSKE